MFVLYFLWHTFDIPCPHVLEMAFGNLCSREMAQCCQCDFFFFFFLPVPLRAVLHEGEEVECPRAAAGIGAGGCASPPALLQEGSAAWASSAELLWSWI